MTLDRPAGRRARAGSRSRPRARWRASSRDGVWLVELAPSGRGGGRRPARRPRAVGARGPDPLARVIARLRDSDALLLLDACEHVLEEASRIASAVLAECPGVRVLATSREVLHLAGEARAPRRAAAAAPIPAPRTSADSPAVQLFARARTAARPGFDLTPDAARLAAEITRRVDGLPLAIELAAARVNVLGLAELLSIVERRLRATSRPLGVRSEPRPCRGLVDWSYDLLHADEKTLLHHVAVHRGGASLPSLLASPQARARRANGHLPARARWSTSRSSPSPSPMARRGTTCLTPSATTRSSVSPKRGGLPAAARKAHAEYFATLADGGADGAAHGWSGRPG